MQILSLHVIPGTYKAGDLTDGLTLETLAGQPLVVGVADGTVTFTAPDMGVAATVTEADIMSCDNVVHKIDSVLVPGIPEVTDSMPPTGPVEDPMPAPRMAAPEEEAAPADAPAADEMPAPTQMPEDGRMAAGDVPCSQTCFYEVVAEMEWTANRCAPLHHDIPAARSPAVNLV